MNNHRSTPRQGYFQPVNTRASTQESTEKNVHRQVTNVDGTECGRNTGRRSTMTGEAGVGNVQHRSCPPRTNCNRCGGNEDEDDDVRRSNASMEDEHRCRNYRGAHRWASSGATRTRRGLNNVRNRTMIPSRVEDVHRQLLL